jgi:hypothetical protein
MKTIRFVAAVVALLVMRENCHAVVGSTLILESATLGNPSQGNGTILGPQQYVGARFHLTLPTQVDRVGGFIGPTGGNSATVFAAIAALASPDGFPAVRPSDFQPLAATTILLPSEMSEVEDHVVPLSVLLQPGDYALIFGSGRFGGVGVGQITRGNPETAQASYFLGSFPNTTTNLWRNESGLVNMRFLVYGTTVPEPTAAVLATLAAPLVMRLRRRT